MKQEQLMTAGAVAFAAFAAWYVLKKPAQPAAIARNLEVNKLFEAFDRQMGNISFGAGMSEYETQLSRMGGGFTLS